MPVPRNVQLLTAIAAGAVATATCAGVVLVFDSGAATEATPRLARPASVGAVLAVSHTSVRPAPRRDAAAGSDAGAFLMEMVRLEHEARGPSRGTCSTRRTAPSCRAPCT